jgi:hypothetical protein
VNAFAGMIDGEPLRYLAGHAGKGIESSATVF